MTYLTNNEIAVNSFADAQLIAEKLLANDYVVMISKEEYLYIINYIWSENGANRNDVVFQKRDILEEEIFNPTIED